MIGSIVRALGHDLKPILIQFLKLHNESHEGKGFFMGEIHFLKSIIPIKQFGTYEFVNPEKLTSEDISKAKEGIECANSAINSGKYDLVVLDEVVDAISFKLIDLNDLLKILKNKPHNVEVMMTGFNYIPELIEIADYITRYACVKHPFSNGFEARAGIEY